MSLDVIIVGGGPVGVTTALLLAQRGLSVRVVEKDEGVYDLPRAVVIDAEIQRVFQGLGLTEQLHALTTPNPGAEFVRPGGERIMGHEMPVGADYPLGHHPTVCFYQPELERFLRAEAERRPRIELVLGTEVIGVEPSTDGVTVETVDEGWEASWVVAADGASSPTRKSLGIPFVDQGFNQDWLVVDFQLTEPVDTLPRFVQQICDPDRPTTFVTGHADYRRWEFQLQPGDDRATMTDPAEVWRLVEPWLGPDQARLVRAVVYQFHATVAERMRHGRVFLAGDAAHQMPPFLGQGLCSGIRDGANLAWKLDLVERGLAADALLDTYDEERRPHAAQVVAHAVDIGNLIDELSGREAPETGRDAGYGGGRPFPTLDHGIRIGEHNAVGRQLLQPIVDGRPLDHLLGPGFAIVVRRADVLPRAVVDRWSAIGAHLVELSASALDDIVPENGMVVVRPDRYVAAVTDDPVTATEAVLTLLHHAPGN